MTHAEFVTKAANIASFAASWAGITCDKPDALLTPMRDKSARHFLREMRARLDAIEAALTEREP